MIRKHGRLAKIALILLYFLAGPMQFPQAGETDQFKEMIIGYYAIGLLFITLLLFFDFEGIKRDFKAYFSEPRKNILKSIKYLFLALVLYSIFRFLAGMIENIGTNEGTDLIDMTFSISPFYVFFAMILYSPFVETFVFKKILHELIQRKYIFIFVSTILYAYLHVGYFVDFKTFVVLFLPFFGRGLVYAYSYAETKNMFVPIVGILIYNCFMYTTLFFIPMQ
jgi:membrane protease YdiL (CAAX protease family)